MSEFMRASLRSLAPYVPGEQPQDKTYIKLNTNESPYPPSPRVLAAIGKDEAQKLRLYSDPLLTPLKEALAATFDVKTENVFAGNGSDECLDFAFYTFCENGAAFPDITYGFYRVFCALYGIKACEIPLNADFEIDPADYAPVKETLFIANPNAPTGLALSPDVLEALIRADRNRLVVVDEAYVDFGARSVVPLTKQYDNLLVVGTFSKSRQLAGARVGYAVGNAALISDLEAVRFSTNPYNINRLSMACAVAALEDKEYFDQTRNAIIETRTQTARMLRERGFVFPDSKTNFLLAKKEGLDGHAFYLALKERGILVRHFQTPRLADYVRITIGTPEDMQAFIRATDEITAT